VKKNKQDRQALIKAKHCSRSCTQKHF